MWGPAKPSSFPQRLHVVAHQAGWAERCALRGSENRRRRNGVIADGCVTVFLKLTTQRVIDARLLGVLVAEFDEMLEGFAGAAGVNDVGGEVDAFGE